MKIIYDRLKPALEKKLVYNLKKQAILPCLPKWTHIDTPCYFIDWVLQWHPGRRGSQECFFFFSFCDPRQLVGGDLSLSASGWMSYLVNL